MKRVLVTGGAGFIGSHLCTRLLNEGNYVICLDNFFTGRKSNIKGICNDPNFELIEHDIINPIDLKVDQIYNLACPASPIYYQYDPVKTIQTSFIGTFNMLDLARKNNATILQASTSEIYGDPAVHPQKESYCGNVNTLGIRACYDEGKRAAETICMDFHRQYGVNIKIIRIFNTYGPNMRIDDGRVISNFIIQALKNEDITIYGDGNQTRSFQYISDLINGMTKMMDSDIKFIGPVNIGNPLEYSMKELAEFIINKTGSKSNIIYKPLPQDDPKKRKPDISLAKEKLDWIPVVDLNEGINCSVEYFKEVLNECK